jgi:hypothetical protein
MDKLDEARHLDVLRSLIAAQFGREEKKFGAKTFAATSTKILSNVGSDGDGRSKVLSKLLIDFFKFITNHLENGLQGGWRFFDRWTDIPEGIHIKTF